tara:strand:+ start:47 stop:640 length:594 start_codon:yes stop_codon:yes gene_type:complete
LLIKSNITLASSSKRRLDLLRKIGIEPYRIINPEINEMNFEDIPINKRPREIAFQKALAAKEKNPATDNFIIAGDNIVFRGKKTYDKTDKISEVKRYLNELSGKKHFVLGGLCVLSPNGEISKRTVKTEVFFKKLSNTEISDEDLQKDGLNKAGGYAIQNLGSLIVSKIKGSYFNVVGLCLFELVQMLKGLGWKNIN